METGDTGTRGDGPAPARSRWAPMPFIALGVSLIIMDATIVNVAVPTIIGDLSLDASQAEWINSVYPLSLAALLILFGRMGDLLGRRRLFIAGLLLFGASSLIATLAGSGGVLIAGRLLQGVGAAMILPATLATVNASYTGRDRGVAFAIWGSTIGGMAAVGPLAGGWLTTDLSWRWAFLLNLPVILVVIAGTVRYVPETTDPHATRGADVPGALASVIGLGALVFALIEGERFGWWRTSPHARFGDWQWPWAVSPTPVALVVSAVALTLLVIDGRARARAGRPVLLDLSLFRIRGFRYGSIAALVVALGEFGLLFALPLCLQGALGYSALGTGVLILALAVGTFLSSGTTARFTRRYGARAVVRAGLAIEAVAVAGLRVCAGAEMTSWTIAGWLFLYGAGVGLATAQLTSVILDDVPVEKSGQASGMQSTVRQVGSALGIASLGTMLIVLLGTGTTDRLARTPGLTGQQRAAVSTAVRESAGAIIPTLAARPGGQAIRVAATAAMVDATRVVLFCAAGVLALGLLATFALPCGAAIRPAVEEVGSEELTGA
ncbi:MFS transporter [Sphaerisporangium rhizosphaerae]|uniref:MFS transporter n=1 Tax=Sphaerisporangium rhizosphaerae TaxID=2269375 RepID=A0ABW2PK08_9ACTN